MNAISEIKRLPSTKEERKAFVEQVVADMMHGVIDPLELMKFASEIGKIFEEIKKHPKVLEFALDEADKYPEKIFTHNEIEFEKCERRTFDYSDNEKWRELDKAKKQHELFLKNLPTEGVADPDTGEIIYPAKFKTSTFFKIK